MAHERGEARWSAKLNPEKVAEIWAIWHCRYVGLERRPTLAAIGREYGVSAVNVHHIVTGKRWCHVTAGLRA